MRVLFEWCSTRIHNGPISISRSHDLRYDMTMVVVWGHHDVGQMIAHVWEYKSITV